MTTEINGKPAPALSDEEAAAKLDEACKLSNLGYERQRGTLANEIGVTKGALDNLRKQKLAEASAAAGLDDCDDEMINGIEPWPDKVDGNKLADDIHTILMRYCVMQKHTDVVTVLWIIAHYNIDHCRIFPKLLINSPQKRCGKSTLLEVLDSLCHRSMTASNVSTAVIFRVIESYGCSLLLDEADTWIHGNEEMRGIINCGNTRAQAYVWRVEGEQHEPKRFSVFSPMVLAMIGEPPDTITDRSVPVTLRRKLAGESVAKLPLDLKAAQRDVRRKLKRWADDNGQKIVAANPVLPPIENDRALDNYGPLAAVAELIGGEWPVKLRAAIKANDTGPEDETDTKVELLRDIQEVIDEREERTSMFSSDLVQRLNNMEDRPWPEINNGKALSQRKLAVMLKPFGITSKQLKISSKGRKGYEFGDFDDAIKRYVSSGPQTSETSETSETTKPTAADCGYMGSDDNQVSDTSETQRCAEVSDTNETMQTSVPKKPQQTGKVSDVSDVSLISGPNEAYKNLENF